MSPRHSLALIIPWLTLLCCGCSRQLPIVSAPTARFPDIPTQPQPTSEVPKGISIPITFIKDVYDKNNTTYLAADAAEMLSGKIAETMALKETGCSREHLFDGDCAPSLNNAFYISNPVTTTIPLPLAKTVKITMTTVPWNHSSNSTLSVTLTEFKKLFHQPPFSNFNATMIPFNLVIQNGEVITITEQYLP